jgi:hypothetical protein
MWSDRFHRLVLLVVAPLYALLWGCYSAGPSPSPVVPCAGDCWPSGACEAACARLFVLGCLDPLGSDVPTCIETCGESFSCPVRMAGAASCEEADGRDRCE